MKEEQKNLPKATPEIVKNFIDVPVLATRLP